MKVEGLDLNEHLRNILKETMKDYKPFIEDLGNGAYKINGSSSTTGRQVTLITGIKGKELAEELLRREIEKLK